MLPSRKTLKRKYSSTEGLSLFAKKNKRSKINFTVNDLPVPHHINMDEHGRFQYHFDNEKAAFQFLTIIQSHPDLVKNNILETKIGANLSTYDGRLYACIKLTRPQVDVLFGKNAYKKLYEIHHIIINDSISTRYSLLVPKLMELNPELFNQAALLRADGIDGLCAMNIACIFFDSDVLLHLISKLSIKTCNQIVRLRDLQGLTLLNNLIKRDLIPHFMAITNQLTPDIGVEALLVPSKRGICLLEQALETHDTRIIKLISFLFKNAEAIKKIQDKIAHLIKISILDGGEGIDNWSFIAGNIIELAPEAKKRKAEFDIEVQINQNHPRYLARQKHFISKLSSQGWRFLRLQGRTILLIDKAQENIYAIKLKKNNETEEELKKEYITTLYLKEQALNLNLKSNFPSPIGITKISGLSAWLRSQVSKVQWNNLREQIGKYHKSHIVYLYQVNINNCDYFTYLHDPALSEQEYKCANEKAVHDLYTLLKKGLVFPQLADIFHNSIKINRKDKGRYMVFVDLLRNMSRHGTGRLTAWKKAVEFPNLRSSGIADLGDSVSINEYLEKGAMAQRYFQEIIAMYDNCAGNYILANIMGEYQYVLFLIAGCRGCALTEKTYQKITSIEEAKKEVKQIWENLALQIIDNCSQAVSILTYQKQNDVKHFLSSIVSIERLARQMQYWMTDEYISHLRHNNIPDDIYGKGVPVSVDINLFRKDTFNSKIGCSIDGVNPDLGPVNGQEPIKEANKLFYWMVTLIFTSFLQLSITLGQQDAMMQEKDLEKSEKLRKQFFGHLPEKNYHALQYELCRERLKQKPPLPLDKAKEIEAEAEDHMRKKAALTILNFWRTKKANQPLSNENVFDQNSSPSFSS